jgi:hypothetical protein
MQQNAPKRISIFKKFPMTLPDPLLGEGRGRGGGQGMMQRGREAVAARGGSEGVGCPRAPAEVGAAREEQ